MKDGKKSIEARHGWNKIEKQIYNIRHAMFGLIFRKIYNKKNKKIYNIKMHLKRII